MDISSKCENMYTLLYYKMFTCRLAISSAHANMIIDERKIDYSDSMICKLAN